MVTIGSLFSGVGGIERGLESIGLGPVIWQAESDPFARAVLAKHWPEVHRYNDVREIDASSPAPDIICGGFPCQDISNAGKRAGIDGAKSGLWAEFARIIRVLRPRIVFVENVAALAVRGLDRVLGDLSDLGFDAEWDVLRASDVGAPHLRARLFILAYAYGEHRGLQPWRRWWANRTGEANSADDGAHRLADADGEERRSAARDIDTAGSACGRSVRAGKAESGGRRGSVAHAAGAGLAWPEAGTERGGLAAAELHGDAGDVADPDRARCDGAEDTGSGRGDAGARAEAEGRRTARDLEPERDGHLADSVRGRLGASERDVRARESDTERSRARDMADANGCRREFIGRPGGVGGEAGEQDAHGNIANGRDRPHRFPPGPTGIAGWDGPQPAIRRGDDGLSGGLDLTRIGPGSRGIGGGRHRANRLRVLGNAVVPQQAALAFETLTARILASAAERAA